jgi:hypothetical protein
MANYLQNLQAISGAKFIIPLFEPSGFTPVANYGEAGWAEISRTGMTLGAPTVAFPDTDTAATFVNGTGIVRFGYSLNNIYAAPQFTFAHRFRFTNNAEFNSLFDLATTSLGFSLGMQTSGGISTLTFMLGDDNGNQVFALFTAMNLVNGNSHALVIRLTLGDGSSTSSTFDVRIDGTALSADHISILTDDFSSNLYSGITLGNTSSLTLGMYGAGYTGDPAGVAGWFAFWNSYLSLTDVQTYEQPPAGHSLPSSGRAHRRRSQI